MFKNDLTGQKFGRLLVLSFAYNNKHRQSMWNCKCDCGKITVVLGNELTSGGTQSCGCLFTETICNYKHGYSKTKLGMIRDAMTQRCYNPKCRGYKNYGARGIVICDEWLEDRESFYKWATTHGYKEGLSLDRIDNNGPYSPENCRWATQQEQSNNTRFNVRLTFNGVTLSISEWAKKLKVRPGKLYKRKYRGWSDERILTTP